MNTITRASRKLSALTAKDSDGNTMVKTHAYRARGDGFVIAENDLNVGRFMNGYVGLTTDPAGAGNRVGCNENDSSNNDNTLNGFSFEVARNEYFEITTSGDAPSPTILWRSRGRLKKPIDFN